MKEDKTLSTWIILLVAVILLLVAFSRCTPEGSTISSPVVKVPVMTEFGRTVEEILSSNIYDMEAPESFFPEEVDVFDPDSCNELEELLLNRIDSSKPLYIRVNKNIEGQSESSKASIPITTCLFKRAISLRGLSNDLILDGGGRTIIGRTAGDDTTPSDSVFSIHSEKKVLLKGIGIKGRNNGEETGIDVSTSSRVYVADIDIYNVNAGIVVSEFDEPVQKNTSFYDFSLIKASQADVGCSGDACSLTIHNGGINGGNTITTNGIGILVSGSASAQVKIATGANIVITGSPVSKAVHLNSGKLIIHGTLTIQNYTVGIYVDSGRLECDKQNGTDRIKFLSSSAPYTLPSGTSSTINTCANNIGDFDQNGYPDMAWESDNGANQYLWIYLRDQNGWRTPTPHLVDSTSSAWDISGVGDFDADGKDDIIWRNFSSGLNWIHLMDGASIKPGSGSPGSVPDLNWKIQAIGNFDNAHGDDVFWRNYATGQNWVYLMNGIVIINQNTPSTVSDLNWRVLGAGDFDSDNKDDILWRKENDGQHWVYLMNGLSIKEEGPLLSNGSPVYSYGSITSINDGNSDNKDDLYWFDSTVYEGNFSGIIYYMNGRSFATYPPPLVHADASVPYGW